jgi:hypothetical protein
MPKGMQGVREAVRDIEARKAASGGGGFRKWFKLADGESAVVRFLEQGEDVKWAWCHEVEVPGKTWKMPVPCRDQDEHGEPTGDACPGCEDAAKRKFQGWINVIWRDAPKYKKDKDGKFMKNGKDLVPDGNEDQVAAWQSGITVFEELDGKDVTYKGLMSRDFKVKRRGSGMNTTYSIEPADPDGGPKEMSAKDKKLVEEKYDFTPDVTPQPYDSWGKQEQAEQESRAIPADASPFLKRK